jgi:Cu+-exporting ATPase
MFLGDTVAYSTFRRISFTGYAIITQRNKRTETLMAIDPVCGMEVEAEKAKGRSVHEGATLYFCSMNCKERFDADPVSFRVRSAKLCPAPEKTAQAAVLSTGTAPETSDETSIDPVCRMTVVRSKARGSRSTMGRAIISAIRTAS